MQTMHWNGERFVLGVSPGTMVDVAVNEAVELANRKRQEVEFTFNGTKVIVKPGEDQRDILDRWRNDINAAHEAYVNSAEYKEAEAKRKAEYEAKCAATMKESAQTEKEMREAKDPWPYTMKQLTEYIDSLVERAHDYGTCAYAMSLAATAAFNYVAHKLGVTGFQASCADLDFLKRSRGIKGPFMIIQAGDAVYPQYDLHGRLDKFLADSSSWIKEQAAKNLAGNVEFTAPEVLEHWKKLARQE